MGKPDPATAVARAGADAFLSTVPHGATVAAAARSILPDGFPQPAGHDADRTHAD